MDSSPPRAPARAGWLRRPTQDVTMALVWVPFELVTPANLDSYAKKN